MRIRGGPRERGGDRRLRPVRVVLLVGAVAAVLLAVLDAAVTRIPWAPQWREPESQMRVYFDVAREQNLPTWVNVVLLTLAAAAAGLTAGLARAARDRSAGPWAVFALVLAALSLDDMTALHERLDPLGQDLGGGSGLTYAAWIVPGLAGAAVVVLALVALARRTPTRTRLLLGAGVGLLLAAALGLEAVGNSVLETAGFSRSYAWWLTAEELLETFAAALLLAGGVSALDLRRTADGVSVALYRAPGTRPPTVARPEAADVRPAEADRTEPEATHTAPRAALRPAPLTPTGEGRAA